MSRSASIGSAGGDAAIERQADRLAPRWRPGTPAAGGEVAADDVGREGCGLGVRAASRRTRRPAWRQFSGSSDTSSARARWGGGGGSRAPPAPVISRWMPDFDFSCSASFISSKRRREAGLACRCLSMNISSSCCLRVSTVASPRSRLPDSGTNRKPGTCSSLFCRAGSSFPNWAMALIKAAEESRKSDHLHGRARRQRRGRAARAGSARRRQRQHRQHRAVLHRERRGDERRRPARRSSGGAQIVGAAGRSPPRRRRAGPARSAAGRPAGPAGARAPASGTGAQQTSAETGLPGRPSTGAAPSGRTSAACPGRIAICQKSSVEALRLQRRLHQVVVADRGAAGGDQQVACRAGGDAAAAIASRVVAARWRARSARRPRRAPGRASACALELTICLRPIGSPGITISSPVARIADARPAVHRQPRRFIAAGQADVARRSACGRPAAARRRRRSRGRPCGYGGRRGASMHRDPVAVGARCPPG